MAVGVPELSPIQVKRLTHPGGRSNAMIAVGGVSCLYMQITPRGAKSWILRATVGGKRRDIGLGRYPDVTLAQARDRARQDREKIGNGIDPVEERRAARAALADAQKRRLTFADAYQQYAAAKLAELASDADRARWRSSIERYVLPHIGACPVADIDVRDLLRVLEPIWTDKTETASRVRARVEAIISWSITAGYRLDSNPAIWRGNLSTLLPAPARIKNKSHHPAVALADASRFFAELRARKGVGAQALAFLVLCASRSGEVRGATWDEIDRSARVWRISAARMKAEREHIVPLSNAALSIIDMQPRRSDSEYIFAAARGGKLSDMTVNKVMRDMQKRAENDAARAGQDVSKAGWRDLRSGLPAVPNGLRSTFRDWCAELTNYHRDIAEIALAHKVGSDVERAYRRGDMIEKRRKMMDDWAMFLSAT